MNVHKIRVKMEELAKALTWIFIVFVETGSKVRSFAPFPTHQTVFLYIILPLICYDIVGELCETESNYCEPSPCGEGSTCISGNKTWQCLCKPGYLGRHCNLLPCDWAPCPQNSVCENIVEPRANPKSYR